MRGERRPPLPLSEAPDVMTSDQFARVMGWGINYANQVINAGLVVNIGGRFDRRIPKPCVAELIEKLARREVELPPRKRAGAA